MRGDRSWLYKKVLINPVAVRNFSEKKVVPKGLEELNQLILDAFTSLRASTKKRYYWRDLREILTFLLISPPYLNQTTEKEELEDENDEK